MGLFWCLNKTWNKNNYYLTYPKNYIYNKHMENTIHKNSKYDDKYIKLIDDYLLEIDLKNKDPNEPITLPSVNSLSLIFGLSPSTLYLWGRMVNENGSLKYPIFSSTLNKVKQKQLELLINNGLSGRYNSVIAKLILSSNYGFSDKSEVKTNHVIDMFTKGHKELESNKVNVVEINDESLESNNNKEIKSTNTTDDNVNESLL